MPTPLTAVEFFATALAFQTDPADLAADRAAGRPSLVVDVRTDAGWQQGRIPGAIHLPLPDLESRIATVTDGLDTPIVVYCWGPGCNGSTRAALTLATLGYRQVRDLIGGFEYWAREGLAIETDDGRNRRAPDSLTAPTRPTTSP